MANQRVGIDIITSGNPAGAQQVQAALAGVQSAAGQAAAAVAQVGSSADPPPPPSPRPQLNNPAAPPGMKSDLSQAIFHPTLHRIRRRCLTLWRPNATIRDGSSLVLTKIP